MSTAKLLFEAGRLGPAIKQLTSEVKGDPGNTGVRTFLFELLCFTGDWDRAERQLDVIGHQSAQAAIGVEVYRNNIKAERARHRLFAEGVAPNFVVAPPPYIDLLLAAITAIKDDQYAEARIALDKVEGERPNISGKLNDRQFQALSDCDELTGPVLELFLQDRYTWVPFEQIRRIEINAPRNLRDLLWASARIEINDGLVAEVFLPTLYAGTSDHQNDQVRLGRMTGWKQGGNDLSLTCGSRLFLVDDDEKQIFDIRTIEFADVDKTLGASEALPLKLSSRSI